LALPDLAELALDTPKFVAQMLDLVQQRLDVFTARLCLADRASALILTVLEFLNTDLQVLAPGLQLAPGFDVEVITANSEGCGDGVGVGSQ
jgi:hypothetical protein